MAGTAGRTTSDSLGAQQLYEAADAAKEAAEADNLLDAQEIERFVQVICYVHALHLPTRSKITQSASRSLT